jgi:hypothetical protein
VDIFLGQPLLPAPIATGDANTEDTKESKSLKEWTTSLKIAIGEGTS